MNPTVDDIVARVKVFEREAHELLGVFETAPSRIISLAETRKQIGILNLKQTELLEEAVESLEHALFRPAIVMAWAAFMDFLQEKLASDDFVKVHAAWPKWADIKTLDDLREKRAEFAILDAAYGLKILSKNEHKALHGMLSRRNECAHPSGYKPTMNEAIGFISELLNRIPTIGQRSL